MNWKRKKEPDLSEVGVKKKKILATHKNSSTKVISHSDSAKTSIHKTDSLSISYRLQLIECSN